MDVLIVEAMLYCNLILIVWLCGQMPQELNVKLKLWCFKWIFLTFLIGSNF